MNDLQNCVRRRMQDDVLSAFNCNRTRSEEMCSLSTDLAETVTVINTVETIKRSPVLREREIFSFSRNRDR